ncbi:MAG: signal peptide peptidase SppA [Deltaproteobacteria bacterium]|nr:signal peptide peptidase SppA [Deltaproteobacteria bacterium]
MKSKKYWILGTCLFIFFSLLGVGFLFLMALFSGDSDWSEFRGNIAVVEVKGPIFESEAIVQKIKKYRENPSVLAMVLRVDSPGGGVGPSQEIYSAVKRFAEKKKVVVSMGTVAASGGYYVAAPAHKILANPGTITGSIGVLMEHMEIDQLLQWAKISAEVLKAGKNKDVGSSLRKMTPEERALLEDLLNNMHHQFRQAVSEGRKISMEDLENIADGKVYTGEQALGLKLVDQLGDLEDAIQVAKDLAGIKGEPHVIYPKKAKPLLWEALFDEESSSRWLQKILTHTTGYRPYYLMSL